MASLNRVTLIGRVVRDPELRKTNSGLSVTSFSIAVDNLVKNGNEKSASFINCSSWNKTAELITKYAPKGTLIGVDCRLYQRSYVDKNNQNRSIIEVVVDTVQFLEKRNEDHSEVQSLQDNDDNQTSIQEGIDSADDDLPF